MNAIGSADPLGRPRALTALVVTIVTALVLITGSAWASPSGSERPSVDIQREPDRAGREVPAGDDVARNDRHHGLAGATDIAPRPNRPRARRLRRRWRSAELPLAKSVTDHAERSSWNPASGAASRAARWPCGLDRRRTAHPEVDVQRRMNDEIRAPSLHGSGARREGRAAKRDPRVTLFVGRRWCRCSASSSTGLPVCRRSGPIRVADGRRLLLPRSPSSSRRDRAAGRCIKAER